jgi:hypothetical protein
MDTSVHFGAPIIQYALLFSLSWMKNTRAEKTDNQF